MAKIELMGSFFTKLIFLYLITSSWALAQEEQRISIAIGGGLNEQTAEVYEAIIKKSNARHNGLIAIFGINSGDQAGSIQFNTDVFEQRYGAKTQGLYLDDQKIAMWKTALTELKEAQGLASEEQFFNYLDELAHWPPQLKELQLLRDSTAFYFGGGKQERAKAAFFEADHSESVILKYMHHRHKKGTLFVGTSAGAAMQSNPMISYGTSLASLRNSEGWRVRTEKGFGFINGVLIDQHFGQRGRLARLLVAMHKTNTPLGAGVDEDTALIVKNNKWEVVGNGKVTIIELNPSGNIQGATVSFLSAGDQYDPLTKKVIPKANKLKITTGPREGLIHHPKPAFEPLEIDQALGDLSLSNHKKIHLWNGPSGHEGVGISFEVEDATSFYGREGTKGAETVEKIKLKLHNVPNIRANFPNRKSCGELMSNLLTGSAAN